MNSTVNAVDRVMLIPFTNYFISGRERCPYQCLAFRSMDRSAPLAAGFPMSGHVCQCPVASLEDSDQHHARDKAAQMRPKGHAPALLGEHAADAANDLQHHPVDQHGPCRQRYRLHEKAERDKRKHADSWK